MALEWHPTDTSSRVVAAAYDEQRQAIYVRFHDGVEWCYEECPKLVWMAFTAPTTSQGQFIHNVLDGRPHHQHRE